MEAATSQTQLLTRQSTIADFAPGVQFIGAIWRVMLNLSLRHRLKAFFREIDSFGWYNDTVKNSSIVVVVYCNFAVMRPNYC